MGDEQDVQAGSDEKTQPGGRIQQCDPIAPTPSELVIGAAWLTLLIGLTWLMIGGLGASGRLAIAVPKGLEAWEEAAVGAASCLVAGWLVFAMLARYQTMPDSVGQDRSESDHSVGPLLAGMLIRLAVVFVGIALGTLAGLNRTPLFWVSFVGCYLVSLAFEAVWLARRPLMAALWRQPAGPESRENAAETGVE